MENNGRFEAKDLMFKVNVGKFLEKCGPTGVLVAGIDCTQQTVRPLVEALTDEQFDAVKRDLLLVMEELVRVKAEIKAEEHKKI